MTTLLPKLIPTLYADDVNSDLTWLIYSILEATKKIALRVEQGGIKNELGNDTGVNVQGETQKKLDIIANAILKDTLLGNGHVRALASEEEEGVIVGNNAGKYVVAFDPLDGSSNVDINGQIGTIFTIYHARHDVMPTSRLQFQLKGNQQLCAGYVLYGPSTLCVMSTGGPTRCFTLDTESGDFLLTIPEMKIPQVTQEFAINMANQRFWSPNFKNYIDDLLQGEAGVRNKRFNMRWNAAMVGDVHRILMRGGIFMYPSDNRDPQQPAKLRLLYEANPLAMLVEHAGGKASTETQRILDINPKHLHQRVAVIMGSVNEVETCLSYLMQECTAA